MILRLVAAILAIVFVALGIPFSIIGLVTDAAEADAFGATGLAALAAGLLFAAVFAVLHRRARAERRRRLAGSRASVEILEARLNHYTRIGVMLTYDLTIRFADGATFARKVLVPPTAPLKVGERIEVLHEPDDRGNFEVAT